MPPNLVDNQPTVFNKLSLLSFEQIGLVKYVKAASLIQANLIFQWVLPNR